MKENALKGSERFIRKKELIEMVGYSASSIWRRCKDGSFPHAVRLGPSSVAWRLSEVEEWMRSRPSVI